MRARIDDITYHVTVAGAGRPLLLLHGFTGSAEAWAPHIPALARHRRVIAPDLIGHGETDVPLDPRRYRMERCVADLLALLDALDAPRADVLGYSMGGRVALQFAATAPGRVARLVLESASPGLAEPEERLARAASDDALADSIECDGLAAFVDRWQAQPLFASQAALPAEVRAQQRAQRLRSRPTGLANSLRGMGTGRQPSLWDRLGTLTIPTLLLAGALDAKYCRIAERMAAALPDARAIVVPNAGHTIHLEQPELFDRLVLEFLLFGD